MNTAGFDVVSSERGRRDRDVCDLTPEQLDRVRAMRDHGPRLTRTPDPLYETLVERGLARRFEDWGGTTYDLTLAGYDLAGRRPGSRTDGPLLGGQLGS